MLLILASHLEYFQIQWNWSKLYLSTKRWQTWLQQLQTNLPITQPEQNLWKTSLSEISPFSREKWTTLSISAWFPKQTLYITCSNQPHRKSMCCSRQKSLCMQSFCHIRFQYISVNGTDSELLLIKHGVSQGSILGPLLLLLYISDLHKAIAFSKIHHFDDDTDFLYESPSLKDIDRKINYDMPRVTHWLRANRISLNVAKTEIILFGSCRTKITKNLNFQISGQKIKTKAQTKCLGIILDEHFNFKKQIETVKQNPARATGVLANLRHYVPKKVLKSIYYVIFDSNIRYGC